MQCLRSVACVVVLLMALGAVQAKVTGVTGDVRLMGPGLALELPENVYAVPTDGEHDVSSPFEGDELKIGVFDEKLGVSPPTEITIAGGKTLLPTKRYDSFFFFFHQATPGDKGFAARGSVKVDNALVGCTSSNGEFNNGIKEVETTPIFGLPITGFYPTTTLGARGLEQGDFASVGTDFNLQTSIVQPGDYARCFTEACPAEPCACSIAQAPCLTGPKCFASVNDLFVLSSQCAEVTDDSAAASIVSGCETANGCTVHTDGRVCFADDKEYKLTIAGTGGCGCAFNQEITIAPCCDTTTAAADAPEATASTTGRCACLEFDA